VGALTIGAKVAEATAVAERGAIAGDVGCGGTGKGAPAFVLDVVGALAGVLIAAGGGAAQAVSNVA
jgi:hypothetical protein